MANTRQWGLPGFPPVIKNLIIINFGVWLWEISSKSNGQWVIEHFALYDVRSPLFKPWQFITYMFLHQDRYPPDQGGGIFWQHIAFNMFALWMFGSALETLWGSRRFLWFYLICGVGSVVLFSGITYIHNTHLLADPTTDPARILFEPILGASGAVFGVLVAFGYTYPNVELIILPIPIPIKAKWLVIGYVVLELVLGIYQPGDEVAHFAHVGGALVGFLLVYFWFRKYRRNRQDFY